MQASVCPVWTAWVWNRHLYLMSDASLDTQPASWCCPLIAVKSLRLRKYLPKGGPLLCSHLNVEAERKGEVFFSDLHFRNSHIFFCCGRSSQNRNYWVTSSEVKREDPRGGLKEKRRLHSLRYWNTPAPVGGAARSGTATSGTCSHSFPLWPAALLYGLSLWNWTSKQTLSSLNCLWSWYMTTGREKPLIFCQWTG